MMKTRMKQIVCVVLALIMAVLVPTFSVSAGVTEAYTHWDIVNGQKVPVYSRDVYEVSKEITATSLGLDKKISGITDIFCHDDGTTYLLCGEDSKLFVLNKDYTLRSELTVLDEAGDSMDFTGAKGIYVDKDGVIYLSDTQNEQVLVMNSEGMVQSRILLPESDVIPDDFIYQPTRVIKDERGYTYLLCLGSYYGTLLFSPEGDFIGFYGANTVNATVLDTLAYLWDLLTSNDEKKAQSQKKLPYTIVDLAIDSQGYICTGTGSTSYSGTGTGQIRKISPGGSSILYKRKYDGTAADSSGYNFLEMWHSKRSGYYRVQNTVAVDVSDSDNLYILDDTYGKIYMYDTDCNLLSVFGGGVGQGVQHGMFDTACAMAVNGEQVLVADSKTCTITLFELTDFGNDLITAQKLYTNGDYVKAKPYWESVLAQDGNSRLACRGLSKAYYAENNMDMALIYAQKGMDYVTYDYAHQYRITKFIENNFLWVFPLLLVVVGALVAFLIYVRKRQTALIHNVAWQNALTASVHPFQSFGNVKYKGQGSMWIATLFVVLFFVSTALKYTASGFLFNKTDMSTYSSLYTLAQTIGLVILWTIANWLVCTVFAGKAKMTEIYMVSSYSLVPIVLYNFVYVLLSHVVSLEGVELVNGIYTFVLVFTFFLLCVGIMTVQEYGFPKFVITTIVTLLFMILIVFVLFMIVVLIQQFGTFVYSIFMEVAYR